MYKRQPTYYTSRIYIDFTNTEEESLQFERLVRWIYDKPLHIPPKLGKAPSYIVEDGTVVKIQTSVTYSRAIEAIKANKSFYVASVSDFFDDILRGLPEFNPDREADPYDDEVVKFIDAFTPYRNEIINILEALTKYAPDTSYLEPTKKFLEGFYPFTVRGEDDLSCREWDWDVHKFLHHEIFLYIIAVLIKREKFKEACNLINGEYFIKNAHEKAKLKDVSLFRKHLKSLEFRNDRLSQGKNSKRLSIHADMLKERCSGISITFTELMQADFVLYLSRYIHAEDTDWRMPWFPITLIYVSYDRSGFEIFIRAETSAGMNNIQTLLNIPNKQPISDLLNRIQNEGAVAPRFDGFRSISVSELSNYDKLGTRK